MVRSVVIGLMTTVLLSLTGLGVASAQTAPQTFVSRTSFDELVNLSARIVSSTSPDRSKPYST
jgi:hypothetical protein